MSARAVWGILVDRDGVLVEEVPFVGRPSQIRVLDGVGQAVARAHLGGFGVWCCTNQSVVARGEVTLDGLDAIHAEVTRQMSAQGDALDGWYVCPHHPNPETPHPNREFCVPCECRKPQPGLLLQAAREHGLHNAATVYVGDRTTDLAAARGAGMVAVGVDTGFRCRDARHPFRPEVPLVPTFAHAVDLVVNTSMAAEALALRPPRVVLVGGPSRAGKTRLAVALCLALERAGRSTLHISLDRFILPAAQRMAPSALRERLGMDQADVSLRALLDTGTTQAPRYDPVLRASHGVEAFALGPNQTLVVDGILACSLGLRAHRIFVDAPSAVRHARTAAHRAWKGLDERALALAAAQDTEEETLALQERARADEVVSITDQGNLVHHAR